MLSILAALYIGLSGELTLPQGGSDLAQLGGASLRVGSYLSDNWAIEGEGAWLEDAAGLGVQALGHFSAWTLYDRFFGFSAFDPFVTFGARGWLGERAEQVGPKAGLGFFYHLDDNWSLRADGDVTLGLDTEIETIYSFSFGVQYAF